jgi:hypothetical protein
VLGSLSPAARALVELQYAFFDHVTNVSGRLKEEVADKAQRRAKIREFLRDLQAEAERDAYYARDRVLRQVRAPRSEQESAAPSPNARGLLTLAPRIIPSIACVSGARARRRAGAGAGASGDASASASSSAGASAGASAGGGCVCGICICVRTGPGLEVGRSFRLCTGGRSRGRTCGDGAGHGAAICRGRATACATSAAGAGNRTRAFFRRIRG